MTYRNCGSEAVQVGTEAAEPLIEGKSAGKDRDHNAIYTGRIRRAGHVVTVVSR